MRRLRLALGECHGNDTCTLNSHHCNWLRPCKPKNENHISAGPHVRLLPRSSTYIRRLHAVSIKRQLLQRSHKRPLSVLSKYLTIRIWTLPTSSEQSFAFAPVVSTVAFVYPAFFERLRPGHSVVRAAGTKRSIDHGDHHCYRPCSAAGLACFDSAATHHNHKKIITPLLITPAVRRALRSANCH